MVHRSGKYYRLPATGWLVFTQLYSASLSAQDDLSIIQYIPDFVTLNYVRDNDHGVDTFIYANLGLTMEDRLIVGVGEQTETVTRSEEELDNKTYLIGYTYFPHNRANYGIEYEHWGDSAKVTTDSLSAVLSFNFGTYALSLNPKYRIIDVTNESQCEESIYSSSVKVDLGVDFNPDFTFTLGYAAYDYSDNLDEIVNCVSNVESLLVESRVESVANDSEVSVSLDYYLDDETYGISAAHGNTALNNLVSKTISLYVSSDRLDDWTLTATTGITENTDDSTTLFLGMTITYYW